MSDWPVYSFGRYMGPVHNVRAWLPTKLWYGKWVWGRMVSRRRVAKRGGLDGSYWEFWSHTDADYTDDASKPDDQSENTDKQLNAAHQTSSS